MAPPPLVAVSDLSAWVGQDIPDADPRAGAVLSAASALVRAEAQQTWVDDAGALTEVPDDVQAVTVQVAARVWFNPKGATSSQVGAVADRWAESAAAGLYLTDEDRRVLSQYRSTAPSGIGVMGTTRGEDYTSTIYVPTGPSPSGYPFPWYDSSESF